VHQRLVLENNTIEAANTHGIHVTCTDTATIQGNQISGARIPIRIAYSRHVTVKNNQPDTVEIGPDDLSMARTLKKAPYNP